VVSDGVTFLGRTPRLARSQTPAKERYTGAVTRKEFLQATFGSTVLGSVRMPSNATAADRVPPPDPAATENPATQQPPAGTAARRTFPAGITRAVVQFITNASFDRIPEPAVGAARRCLIDGFGVVLAGATVHGSAIVRELITASAGKAEATVFGPQRVRGTAAHAALANAASGHAMDYDDTQLSTTPDRIFGLLTHPTVPVLSASLAISERLGASGRTFVEAFLTGFEVECKMAEAINPAHYVHGFHSTGTLGTFGAVASAAKLLALTPVQTAHALGIAASMSSGIRVNFGSMTKPLHAGRAAENGITAAELASRGFTAGDDPLDGEWGFFQVLGGGADVPRIVPVLGAPFSIVDPGVSVKPYPCGSLGHPTMDAMLKLVTDHDVKPDQIAHVRVRAGSNILNPLRYTTAKTELEAKFCLPFMMASIALRRRAGIREFTDEFVASAPVQAMMSRVETMFDPAIEARGFDKMRSSVDVELKDGRKLSQPSDERYRGGPERPFTRAELHEKFSDCASLLLPPDRIRRALDLIETIEKIANIRELVEVLSN
jgi:2-methylcitrate dehydratase PrpD